MRACVCVCLRICCLPVSVAKFHDQHRVLCAITTARREEKMSNGPQTLRLFCAQGYAGRAGAAAAVMAVAGAGAGAVAEAESA